MQKYQHSVNSPQTEPIIGKESLMEKNYAGGYVFKLDDLKTLDRFLILGSDSPTYYASARKLTKEHLKNIMNLINTNGKAVIDRVVEISHSGRAPHNDPALFVLAATTISNDPNVRKYAFEKLPLVARIGTHLFHFVEYVKAFRGWGRSLRKGVSHWYLTNKNLPLQLVKYQSRDGMSHQVLIRLSHPKTDDPIINKMFNWSVNGVYDINEVSDIPLIYGFELIKKATNEDEVVKLIKKYNLPREAVPTQFMGNKVWTALFPNLNIEALVRNLGNLSRHGVLTDGNFNNINFVVEKLHNVDIIQKSRMHPLQFMTALSTYKSGRGLKGSGTWYPIPNIVSALEDAFYLSFKNVIPSNKKILLALDVSGSMSVEINNLGISAREATAILAMVTMRTEPNWSIVGFTHQLSKLNIDKNMTLNEVVRKISGLSFGSTDCSLPMLYAKDKNLDYDAIVIYTDNETYFGNTHPSIALAKYRKFIKHDVKLVVVGMTSTQFSIADPTDNGMLDVVGFDSNSPSIISDFISDKI